MGWDMARQRAPIAHRGGGISGPSGFLFIDRSVDQARSCGGGSTDSGTQSQQPASVDNPGGGSDRLGIAGTAKLHSGQRRPPGRLPSGLRDLFCDDGLWLCRAHLVPTLDLLLPAILAVSTALFFSGMTWL